MLYDPITETVFCFGCNKWLKLREETYSEGEQRKCFNNDHIVGYEKDLPEIFGK